MNRIILLSLSFGILLSTSLSLSAMEDAEDNPVMEDNTFDFRWTDAQVLGIVPPPVIASPPGRGDLRNLWGAQPLMTSQELDEMEEKARVEAAVQARAKAGAGEKPQLERVWTPFPSPKGQLSAGEGERAKSKKAEVDDGAAAAAAPPPRAQPSDKPKKKRSRDDDEQIRYAQTVISSSFSDDD